MKLFTASPHRALSQSSQLTHIWAPGTLERGETGSSIQRQEQTGWSQQYSPRLLKALSHALSDDCFIFHHRLGCRLRYCQRIPPAHSLNALWLLIFCCQTYFDELYSFEWMLQYFMEKFGLCSGVALFEILVGKVKVWHEEDRWLEKSN